VTSMKDIKQRIYNVNSTEQIIKAMDMIASTKLHKARAQLNGVRPICFELKKIVDEIGALSAAESNQFYKEREVIKSSLYMVFTSDRGFSGGYNANIISKSHEHMNQGKNEKLIVIGSKGYHYFKNRNKNIIWKITDITDTQVYYEAEDISKWILNLYLSGEVDEVFVCYTQFENVLSNTPVIERILPLPLSEVKNDDIYKKYEPDLDSFLEHIVPLYLHMYIFRAFSESHTSEHASRMVSMDAAGKNASDMINKLTRMYNRRRQTAITQEISEIVGSANILYKGGINE